MFSKTFFQTTQHWVRLAVIVVASMLLAACGDSKIPSTITPPPTVQTSSGYVADAAVTGASCSVFAIANGVAGTTALGSGTSNAGAVEFGAVNLTGPAQIQCTGGTFTDEATGQTLDAPNMSVVVDFTPGGTYVISLLSEIASRLALGQGDLGTALTTYNTAVADSFGLDGIDITTQIPTDLNTTNAEDNAAGHFGTALAALSQAVQDGSLGSTREEVLAAATTDVADGRMSSESVAALDQAMVNFMAGNAAAKAHANIDVATQVLSTSGAGVRPVANAGSDQSAIAAGTTVTLSGSGTDADGEIAAYLWTQTSGTSVSLVNANTATATFTAPSASKLEFTLTVVDNVDNRHSDSVTILIDTAIDAGADVTKTFGDAPYTQAATGGGSSALSYGSSDSNVATVDSAGKVTIVGAGTATITATNEVSGSDVAVSDSYVLTVNKAVQAALNAGADVIKAFGDVPFTQAASGGSGSGSVTYASSAEAVVTVDNTGKVTIVGAGSATVTATKAADGNYTVSSDSYSVTVGKAVQATLTAGADVTKTFGDAAFTQAATGGSGTGGVSYTSSNASVASVTAAGTVTVVAPGTAVITATKAGDANYNATTDSYDLTVAKAAQAALNAGADVTKTFGDAAFMQTATGGSGSGAVTYASSATGVATVTSAGLVTIVGAGSATITATKAGDANYNAATDSYVLTVTKTNQAALEAGADVTKTFGDAAFTQTATGGSGSGAVTYASSATGVATVTSAGLVTIVGAGSATITATMAADTNHTAAVSDSYTLTVSKAAQAALDAGADVTKTFGDAVFTQTATGGSGSGALTYASSATGVATVTSAGVVTIVGVGSATVTATKAADSNYNATTDIYALTVAKAAQTGFSAGNDVVKTDGDAAFTQTASGGQGSGAISYSSDTTSVATVNATSGLVTLVGVGTANITATRASDANYLQATDAYTVTVRAQAPTGFAVTAGDAQVTVSWTALAGATSYNLYHATASFGSPPNVANYASFANGTLVQNLTGTSTVVSGLTNGTTYYFVLSAQKATGETAPTEQISVMPVESYAGTFDGVDDYVDTGINQASSFTIADGSTYSAKIRYRGSISDSYQPVFAAQNGLFFVGKAHGSSNVGVEHSGYHGAVAVGTNAWDGSIHTLTYVQTSTQRKIYVDGILEGTVTVSSSNQNAVIDFGREKVSPTGHFNGDIFDVRFFTRAVSDSEVLQIHNGDTIDSGLLAHYPVSERAGTTTYDVSGNGNHGTATNITEANFWANTQDEYHYNSTKGFSNVPLFTNTGPTTTWGSGLSSADRIDGNGYAQFVAAENNRARIIGLSNDNPNELESSIDYGIFLRHDGFVTVLENNVGHVTSGTVSYVPGDVFEIRRTGTSVEYKKNGTTFYTSTVSSTGSLLVDTSSFNTGATVFAVTINGKYVTWDSVSATLSQTQVWIPAVNSTTDALGNTPTHPVGS